MIGFEHAYIMIDLIFRSPIHNLLIMSQIKYPVAQKIDADKTPGSISHISSMIIYFRKLVIKQVGIKAFSKIRGS